MSDLSAAQVIYRELNGSFGDFNGDHAERALAALAADGYAVVRLPESHHADPIVAVVPDDPHGLAVCVLDRSRMTPDRAREMAGALLAAAQSAEAGR